MQMEKFIEFGDSEDDGGMSIKKYDLSSSPNDFNVATLFDLIDSGMIVIPDFQRNYVWDKKKASKLIESLILGLPVPQIFLYEERDGVYQIIDGQQRMLSIYFFMLGKFPTMQGRSILKDAKTENNLIDKKFLENKEYFKEFRLYIPTGRSSEGSPINGLNYNQVDDLYKFRMKTIRTIIISKRNASVSDNAVYEIFNRLNSGGVNLNAQEIRMSLGASYLMDKLKAINENSAWRYLLASTPPDPRFKDIEILLRAVAMALEGDRYAPSMTSFLNSFAELAKNFDTRKVDEIVDFLTAFIENCKKEEIDFGKGSAKLSVPIFEAIFAACYKLEFLNIKSEMVEDLQLLKPFEDSTSGKTTSHRSVESRIDLAYTFIGNKIHG